MFTASQGNKDIVTSPNPSRADMYGSVQVSHKAQLVIMLQRDKAGPQGISTPAGVQLAGPGEYSPIAKFSIDKQNRGTTGDFRMWYQGDRFTFRDLAPEEE